MENNDLDFVMRSVQKLLELSNSPNANEAAAAAGKINELLLKYNLDLESIKDKGIQYESDRWTMIEMDIDFEKARSIPLWKIQLASAVARNNLCRLIIGYKRMSFLGHTMNVEIVTYAYQNLSEQLERIVKVEAKEAKRRYAEELYNYYSPVSFRASWLSGAVVGISESMQKEKEKFESSSNKARALVVVRMQDVDNFLKDMYPNTGKRFIKGSVRNNEAYGRGYEVGKGLKVQKAFESNEVAGQLE